jgi:hypothetical protein
MKKWVLVLLLIALLFTNSAAAQNPPKASEVNKPELKTQKGSMKAISILGQVSDEGKTLISDEDDIWAVDNPSSLAGHVGQQVKVKCRVFPGRNEIHVFSVKVDLREVRYVSKSGDSAFRR